MNDRYKIGFLTTNLTPSYFWHQWYIVNSTARNFNTHLFTFSPFIFAHDTPSKEDFFKTFELATQNNVDGLLISTGTLKFFDISDWLEEYCRKRAQIPIVSLAEPFDPYHSVLIDNKEGMANLIRHFTDYHGYKKIAFVRGSSTNKEAELRFAAYKEVLQEKGILYNPALVWDGDFSFQAGHKAACEFLDTRNLTFEALIAANDDMAMGAFLEFQRRGIRIPDEIAVGGFDNIEAVKELNPPLTTVSQPLYSQIETSFQILLDLIEGKKVPSVTLLPAEIIQRRSCGCQEEHIQLSTSRKKEEFIAHNSFSHIQNFDFLKFRDSLGSFAAFTGVITMDQERIKQWLKNLIRDLDIPSYFLSFYNDRFPLFINQAPVPPAKSTCILASYKNKPLPLPEKGLEFQTRNLIPTDEFLSDKAQSFICSEIQFKNEHYGYFLADVTSSDSLLILLLKVQLSGFFHSIYVQHELEIAYKKMKELDEAKTRFFMNVSHEVRTPLTLLLGPLESIIRGDLGQKLNHNDEIFSSMFANASRLLTLISNLLDFSKIEAGRMVLRKKKIAINKLLSFYSNSLDSTAKAKGLSFQFIDRTDRDVISAVDQALLEQAVFNLIANAFKFTPKNGNITLNLSREENIYTITVKDSGIGIPEEKIDIIFERFTQADDSISRKYGGTGIGLAFALEIVKLHGGTIKVESEMGKGATFSIILPIDDLEQVEDGKIQPSQMEKMLNTMEIEQEEEAQEEISEIEEERKRILVVEDNRDMRRFISSLLKNDYRLHTAVNGKQGYDAVKQFKPDLIISDVMMPVMDGYTFAALLKSSSTTQDIPIILLSAKTEVTERIEGIESGADDYLTKPFHPLELKARVATHLRMKAFREEKTAALWMMNQELNSAIDQLKDTQEQLIESEKMAALGGLVAGVAHEINTPVGVSVTAASHLKQLSDDIQQLYETQAMKRSDLEGLFNTLGTAAEMILNNLERADGLIKSFKQMAVDQLAEELRDFNLKKYLEATFISLNPEIKKRRHIIELDCPHDLTITNYPGALSQVITNLVMNSIIHGYEHKEEGKIKCIVETEGRRVIMHYSDFGKGIDKTHIEKIFTPFFTTRRNKGGTGLGMHLVFNLVTQKMGGTIRCESHYGKGTTFIITLPLIHSQLDTYKKKSFPDM